MILYTVCFQTKGQQGLIDNLDVWIDNGNITTFTKETAEKDGQS